MKKFKLQIMYGNKSGVWDEYFEASDTLEGARVLLAKARATFPNMFRIVECTQGG